MIPTGTGRRSARGQRSRQLTCKAANTMVLVCSNMSRMGEQGSFLANSGGVFSVASDVQRIGEKVGAAGLEPQATSSSPLTDVNLFLH